MRLTAKRLVSLLPTWGQQALKRIHYGWQIRHSSFHPAEPEFDLLNSLVSDGDWVIDVANVGHYTRRFSELVGPRGRVVAFEPIPETFALLASNTLLFPHRNVTLLNAAASDRVIIAGMHIPDLAAGVKNYYRASLEGGKPNVHVMTMPLDCIAFPRRVTLIKIDAEGHETAVLHGAGQLLERDHPALIIETPAAGQLDRLVALGYTSERLPGSPNVLLRWASPHPSGAPAE